MCWGDWRGSTGRCSPAARPMGRGCGGPPTTTAFQEKSFPFALAPPLGMTSSQPSATPSSSSSHPGPGPPPACELHRLAPAPPAPLPPRARWSNLSRSATVSRSSAPPTLALAPYSSSCVLNCESLPSGADVKARCEAASVKSPVAVEARERRSDAPPTKRARGTGREERTLALLMAKQLERSAAASPAGWVGPQAPPSLSLLPGPSGLLPLH